ncbi:RanGTP-binding protein-domain-containing protein [Protomyces lactucae-debilis]|uniref:RanGTP-binding protein-domain-containing protein n=1 Tax=Protomyces lactucae-debilis TaxID=2754530 RepID=A0A1Y2FCR0_PROLT|nr:RanGTP-binding protein-domain-containing protein [Protomyces lactucae-debilis]ORY81407.1 RanGTP-binding protein-domain-containing protein [Protomyces lactucae-debilis]
MDALLARASYQFTTFAIRSGISIAGGYAIKQVSTYIAKQPQDLHKRELELLSKRLDQKIKIVTPAIDLIEIIAARGNTTLNSTVQLTVSLRNDINDFGQRMNETMNNVKGVSGKEQTVAIIEDMKLLLARIEDAVPLISLALTTSGANLSASLPETVSPSRLLQASSFLQNGDLQFSQTRIETQIGPSFPLKLYTIFEGHSRRDPNLSDITWQETYAKAIFEVFRMPMAADVAHDQGKPIEHPLEYLYHFRVTEDLNDGRYHEELESGEYKRDAQGFIRGASRDIPVHNVARLFFSASGRLLNIEEARTPVLVLKINHALPGPSALIRSIFANQYGEDKPSTPESDEPPDGARVPQVQSEDDLEWVALEMWSEEVEDAESDDEASSDASEESQEDRPDSADTETLDELAMQMQVLNMSAKTQQVSSKTGAAHADVATLSLLEYILRLAALQTSEQTSLLSISDERISLFLRDDSRRSSSRRRTSDRQVAEPRSRSDRHDTPASAASFDEFIPGTQRRPRYRSTHESGGKEERRSASRKDSRRDSDVHTPAVRARAHFAGDDSLPAYKGTPAAGLLQEMPLSSSLPVQTSVNEALGDTSPLARHADRPVQPLAHRLLRWPRAVSRPTGKGAAEVEEDNPFK